MDRKEIAQILTEIGTMLELLGESPFKSRAYYNGARSVELLTEDIEELVRQDKLKEVKGIGKALDEKIKELVNTGHLEYYKRIKEKIPPGLFDLLKVPGLGPKKVRALYEELGITTLGELEYSCIENRLLELPGFGEKTQKKALEGIQYLKRNRGRYLYPEALHKARALEEGLRERGIVSRISIAGSLRRKNETVKDIDILASGDDADGIMDAFASLPWIERVIERGSSKLGALLDSGIRVDLRVVNDHQFPFALHHFTGSKEHNTAMRHRAKGLGLKINEYGIFSDQAQGSMQCTDEAEFFERLGLGYIPPELRENTGEIEAAEQGTLPRLVEYKDIRGIFHIHTRYSDGTSSIEDMAKRAMEMGMQYIGISDHSRSAYYAGGLKAEDILRQREEINRLNELYSDFRIFAGIESDILTDGSLDYPDEILVSFDFVIASVHSAFTMDRDTMTKRLVRALQNPHVTMLGHPTGRLILAREGYPVDLERVIEAAAGLGKVIELNANPYRLDLDWRWCRRAKEMGVKISISPDAHSPEGLEDMVYGVDTARKGWLEEGDVFNCMPLEQMEKLLKKA
ncbi:MAG: DNA polymerase/3'-5' exonuclease PolX [Clostridiales bacterium]|nr:DNA polymerase/3'-5' exonuclease PolX [Clostridiales bacterium]